MRSQVIRYLFGSFLLLLLMFAAPMSYAVTAASGTPPSTGANFLNGMGSSEKGDSTAPLPFYLFNIYLSTANWWSCSNCNGEQSSLLLPVVGGSTVPPGKYLVTMSVVMNQLDTNGRWVKLSGLRIFDSATNTTLTTTGNQGQISGDGQYPWYTTYTTSNTFTSATTITPKFGFGVNDSSHNETWWQFFGTVSFVPEP